MQDFNELQQAKAVCLKDITEALPRYTERLAAIGQRLTEYVEDAVSGNASHARSTSGRLPLGFLALASVSYRRRAAACYPLELVRLPKQERDARKQGEKETTN